MPIGVFRQFNKPNYCEDYVNQIAHIKTQEGCRHIRKINVHFKYLGSSLISNDNFGFINSLIYGEDFLRLFILKISDLMIDFNKLKEIIAKNNTFLITTHVNPDADAIGSEIAFYLILKKLGKETHIINHSDTPYNLKFLDKDDHDQKV